MESTILLLGIALILIGFFLVLLSALLSLKAGKAEVAVGGFIGPIPFGFATSKNMLIAVMLLSLFTFLATLLIFLK